MSDEELRSLIDELRSQPSETEWLEFKHNNANPQEVGEYISALSNSAKLHNQPQGYILWGIENSTHAVLGTTFTSGTAKGQGNEPLEAWLLRHLEPAIDFRISTVDYEPGKPVVVFEIDPAHSNAVAFRGKAYIRVGEVRKTLESVPAKKARLELMLRSSDWSAEICSDASLDDIDQRALAMAKEQYRQKHPRLADEMQAWDDITFLNKAKLAIDGKLTRSAIILLGKDESSHYLSSADVRVTWILKGVDNTDEDYEHFGPPLILNVDGVYQKIRNLKVRALPDGTLFPKEINQYDGWVIREALHNAIAHQDYTLRARINLIEKPDELILTNAGSFLPGSIDEVIKPDSAPSVYRNRFLANAMVNLNMIDTIGSGIRRMFARQKERFFPMPSFDLTTEGMVCVSISGRILDENYTRLLMRNTDLPLESVILLDRVQKKLPIPNGDAKRLRKDKLVEGRYPNVFVSAQVASATGKKANYIRQRGFDDQYYIDMVLKYLKQYGQASRRDIDDLLIDKLPDVLTEGQKARKINGLLSDKMAKKKGLIRNIGSKRFSKWVLTEACPGS